MWIPDEVKNRAKRVNLIQFLQERYPDLIFEKQPGQFAYTKQDYISFYRGRDGFYRYCDHLKKNNDEMDYFGDSIKFLIDFVGGYKFDTAVMALLDFEKKGH